MLVEFKGVPIEEIAKTMHHTCKTIQRYLSPDYSVEDGHYNARIPGTILVIKDTFDASCQREKVSTVI